MSNLVYLIKHENAVYPSKNLNPSKLYPEYLFDKENINNSRNDVYEMVRELFKNAGLDKANFGSDKWNPLGEYVKSGMNVVIKPNWVNDHNDNKKIKNGMDCLITNTSVLRAVCDYVLIALNGSGKITICDAPIQDCIIEKLWEKAGIYDLMKFYKEQNCPVHFEDLRTEQRIVNKFAVKKETRFLNGEQTFVTMDENTAFKRLSGGEYNVPNYDKDITQKFQHGNTHIYSIGKAILEADIIINICKPKCHRYAGITAAMKNCVGMSAMKETLPHRMYGSVEEGGDSYSKKSKVKKKIDDVLIRQVKLENQKKILMATICRFEYGILYYLSKFLGEDPSLKGCWHGNDTIWRTILDLNYIIRFSDRNGNIKKTQQRNVLNIGDMIVSGQHNGPLGPEPKQLGMIIMSENAAAFDFVICGVMGFEYKSIPLFRNIAEGKTWITPVNPEICSNVKEINGSLNKIVFPNSWQFEPHDAWKGHIEKSFYKGDKNV